MSEVGLTSWGRIHRFAHDVVRPAWLEDLPHALSGPGPKLAYGLGRSYGDSCLNEGGTLVVTRALNRFRDADWHTGVITCEAGVSLAELLTVAVPRGWMLPVTPGTKQVTIGGAVANDVHGKNHHREGTFGSHVQSFELIRTDGQRYGCSPTEHEDLFRATIGGLGLTGVIMTVTLRLKRASPFIIQEAVRFRSLAEFITLSAASDQDYEYTVAWIDATASGKDLGRGIFFRGNHAADDPKLRPLHRTGMLRVPVECPSWMLNRYSVKAFNMGYERVAGWTARPHKVHYDPFFYPLDQVQHWNRIYGRGGFYQYQLVVPRGRETELERIMIAIAASGLASFLAVLKVFGSAASPGLLSFPQPGYTLALDFQNRGRATLDLFRRIDAIVAESGGRLYPAKDSHMSSSMFKTGYANNLGAFQKWRDPGLSSSFWRRVMGHD